MRRTDKNFFKIKNPAKYMGDPTKIIYRSSWELTVMNLFDSHPNIVGWSSETVQIPYFDPTKNMPKGKWTVYIPDFLVVVDDGKGKRHVELVEIKPVSQTPGYQAGFTASGRAKKVNKYTQLEQVRNQAKWTAALAFCAKRGWKFQVMTEVTLFGHGTRKK